MSETITLNFINKTEDIPAANVVICQHNAAAGMRCNPVAWRVLRGVTPHESQSFEVPRAFEVAVADANGNTTTPAPVKLGQVYEVVASQSGLLMKEGHLSSEKTENVSAANLLEASTMRATAYKSGRPVSVRPEMEPGGVAAFRFMEHVYVGLAGRVEEGDLLSVAVASRITTRINLFGVRTADIVMTSSDKGAHAPLFHLENIQC